MPALGSDLSIVITFRDVSDALVDPDSVDVDLLDSDGDSVAMATPMTADYVSEGKYRIEWTPVDTGTFTLLVTGVFALADDIVIEQIFVITSDADDATAPTLGEEVIISFSSGLLPLLIDPETILPFITESNLLEISSYVNRFSLEIQGIFPNGDYPDVAYDYILAATLCALSRLYDGVGDSSYSGFTLGDLQVQQGSSKSSAGGNLGNAASWCEIADLLRKEIRNAKGGIKSTSKAVCWTSPIPSRQLRRAETRRRTRI